MRDDKMKISMIVAMDEDEFYRDGRTSSLEDFQRLDKGSRDLLKGTGSMQ